MTKSMGELFASRIQAHGMISCMKIGVANSGTQSHIVFQDTAF